MTDELKNLFAVGAKQTITITTDILVDNEPLVITDEDIMLGTFSIDRSIMEGSSLNLGSCVAAELNMTLNNMDGRFDGISWSGAELSVELGVEGSNETLPMGVFYVDRTPKTRNTVAISALDGMVKFDKLVTDCTLWRYELEAGSVGLSYFVNWCCTQCGITLATTITGFPNATWALWMDNFRTYLETAKTFTCRNLLSWAIAGMGKVAWMNGDGELEIGFPSHLSDWENTSIVGMAIVGLAIVGNTSGEGEVTDTFGSDKRFASDYEDTVIEFTGVTYTNPNTEVTYLTGTSDYALDLSGNILFDRIESCDTTYNPDVGTKTVEDMVDNLSDLVGITYTPITMEVVPCPHIYPTDWVAYVVDNDHYVYALVTSYAFTLNGKNYISAQGELPQDRQLAPINSVATLQATVDSMTDYVIDQGSSGVWEYRKWKNGMYECWYHGNTTLNITTQSGGVYFANVTSINYPITFASAPTILITTQGSSGCWASSGDNDHGSTTKTGRIWVYRGASSSNVSVDINIYVHGRWK